ncbi:MAG TPA: GNAT family N-acetyltransferase [Ginsengibacter sp.]|nr:GNAT family N-acetyltransferase [Ginsengibacter sp.]
MIKWQCKSFNELTNEELYRILQLRIEVFAVEQNVVYQDCDNKDFESYHFMGNEKDLLVAYSRIIPPGISYKEAASIGRVVTPSVVRGQSVGKQLFEKSLEQLYLLFGQVPVIISAQVYLIKFYESFSFVAEGEVYIEDSIPHITMMKNI